MNRTRRASISASHRRRQSVDGEIAAHRIAHPVAAERDPGLASIGLNVLSQRRDFDRIAVDNQRHRAVIDAGRHALDTGGPGAADHFVRHCRRGDIHFADRKTEQFIANGSADGPRLLAAAVQQPQHARSGTAREPRCVTQRARGVHFSLPGMNLPFSICAGV
jgi:hypothetical protein